MPLLRKEEKTKLIKQAVLMTNQGYSIATISERLEVNRIHVWRWKQTEEWQEEVKNQKKLKREAISELDMITKQAYREEVLQIFTTLKEISKLSLDSVKKQAEAINAEMGKSIVAQSPCEMMVKKEVLAVQKANAAERKTIALEIDLLYKITEIHEALSEK